MFIPPNTTSLLQLLDQGVMEEDSKLKVKQGWKNCDVAKCLVNNKESLKEIQLSTINAY